MRSFALLLAGLLSLAACGESVPPPPNVVVVVIDTLRADDLPPYGGDLANAPFLAQLAAEGLVFENAWAASSWTAPATASIFTSRHPNEHGVVQGLLAKQPKGATKNELNRIPSELETLPEFMKSRGYATFAVTDNINIDAPMGFADGFDRFRYLEGFAESGARRLNEQLLEWKDEILGAEPFFLYLHYMDPHEPYERHDEWLPEGAPPVPEDRMTDRAAYRSEIRNVDENLRAIFDELQLGEETLVLVTADHGQEFLDHGRTGHKWTLYSELTHVPLIVRLGTDGPRGRSAANVGNIDLLPTLRQVLDAPPSDQDRGSSLMAYAESEDRGPRELYSMRTDMYGPRPRELRSIVLGRYKLIVNEDNGQQKLFDLEVDPGETKNLVIERPEVVRSLQAKLDAQRDRAARELLTESSDRRLDAAEIEQLKMLGYTGDDDEIAPSGPEDE